MNRSKSQGSYIVPFSRLFYRNGQIVKSLRWKQVGVADGNEKRYFFGLISAFFLSHAARSIPLSRLELKAKRTPPFRQTNHSNGIREIIAVIPAALTGLSGFLIFKDQGLPKTYRLLLKKSCKFSSIM
ncbi:hypothetical protein HW115_16625 [Verrucomicrobiaceae bacterium N1E253]|uniref:Uncharacterized protein n=1 Tax=Oceaniferula marina TaxID=2748318 RepID=A0A851GJ97_9BACT|nr:hypothetical protein [Oceaniferula marina]NWK57249.1 hypothetical protein [Oceaniferula marina]